MPNITVFIYRNYNEVKIMPRKYEIGGTFLETIRLDSRGRRMLKMN